MSTTTRVTSLATANVTNEKLEGKANNYQRERIKRGWLWRQGKRSDMQCSLQKGKSEKIWRNNHVQNKVTGTEIISETKENANLHVQINFLTTEHALIKALQTEWLHEERVSDKPTMEPYSAPKWNSADRRRAATRITFGIAKDFCLVQNNPKDKILLSIDRSKWT